MVQRVTDSLQYFRIDGGWLFRSGSRCNCSCACSMIRIKVEIGWSIQSIPVDSDALIEIFSPYLHRLRDCLCASHLVIHYRLATTANLGNQPIGRFAVRLGCFGTIYWIGPLPTHESNYATLSVNNCCFLISWNTSLIVIGALITCAWFGVHLPPLLQLALPH